MNRKVFGLTIVVVVGIFFFLFSFGGSEEAKIVQPAQPSVPVYYISGVIVVDNLPLAGVTVGAVSSNGEVSVEAVTDLNGRYVLPSIKNGTYMVTPFSSRYTHTSFSKEVVVADANSTDVDFSASVNMSLTAASEESSASDTSDDIVEIDDIPESVIAYEESKKLVKQRNVSATAALPAIRRVSHTTSPAVSEGTHVCADPRGTSTIKKEVVSDSLVSVPVQEKVTLAISNTVTSPTPNTKATAMLGTEKLLYPASFSLREKDLSLQGDEIVLWTANSMDPDIIVPLRGEYGVAFTDQGAKTLSILNLNDPIPTQVLKGDDRLGAKNCVVWPTGSFDLDPHGGTIVFASRCISPEGVEQTDIFLTKTDGTHDHLQITNDDNNDTSPIIGRFDALTGSMEVLFVSSRDGVTGIWKQTVNLTTSTLVGEQTLVVDGVLDGKRAMSINSDYTRLAFMQNVGGVSHVMVVSLADGTMVDFGPGENPQWAFDGSNKILYTIDDTIFVTSQDGARKEKVPPLSGIPVDLLWEVVFMPAEPRS